MSDEIMDFSSKYILERNGKPIPAVLSAILCARWPRQLAKAFDTVNPILYTVVCIVKGWIEVVREDTERYTSSQEEKDTVIEDPEMVNSCAMALAELCDASQRQLWISWMDLTDEIYQCIKPAVTHNPNVKGEVKESLLDTLLLMHQWTKTRGPVVKHSGVQTAGN
uniref:Importin N-terminal domain-containing protein n=1 Tax=Caenorhabditis tropicalis TaxID=1561998 RepID=A0A1I7V3V7_9PELO